MRAAPGTWRPFPHPMIIRPRPHGWQLLYILRGSIVPAVAPRVLAILLLAIAVAAVVEIARPPGIERISSAPFALLGLVLSIFLSFRNNACHERWWEGRRLWGQLIFESRSLARLRGRDAALAVRPWLVLSAVLAYAFFGLDQMGEEMEEPFGTEPNDLPLDAMVRTVEIDQLDALGHRPLPEPLLPRDYLLQ